MEIKKSGKQTTKQNEPMYKVLEECGTLSTNSKGWALKLRYISWNNAEPKYDLRTWKETENGEQCGKGMTLTGEELEALYNILKGE